MNKMMVITAVLAFFVMSLVLYTIFQKNKYANLYQRYKYANLYQKNMYTHICDKDKVDKIEAKFELEDEFDWPLSMQEIERLYYAGEEGEPGVAKQLREEHKKAMEDTKWKFTHFKVWGLDYDINIGGWIERIVEKNTKNYAPNKTCGYITVEVLIWNPGEDYKKMTLEIPLNPLVPRAAKK